MSDDEDDIRLPTVQETGRAFVAVDPDELAELRAKVKLAQTLAVELLSDAAMMKPTSREVDPVGHPDHFNAGVASGLRVAAGRLQARLLTVTPVARAWVEKVAPAWLDQLDGHYIGKNQFGHPIFVGDDWSVEQWSSGEIKVGISDHRDPPGGETYYFEPDLAIAIGLAASGVAPFTSSGST